MYKCCCGKEFETSNQLNLHKGRCKEYLGEERYFLLQDKLKKAKRKFSEAYLEKRLEKKLQKEKLEAEQIHVCERCGKEFIGNASKYSTNRFCSRSCANKHKNRSEESRRKTSESLKKNKNRRTLKNNPTEKQIEAYKNRRTSKKLKLDYLLNPNYCKICGKELPYEKRHCICCSDNCRKKRLRQAAFENEKFIFSTKSNRYKKGYYR